MLSIKNNLGGLSEGLYVWKKYECVACLSFIGNEDFTLKTSNTTKNWDGILEYSTDMKTWSIWDGTKISSSANKLYLRGIGNTKITGYATNEYRNFVFTGTDSLKISCEGNIETLLDYETVIVGEHPIMGDYCYFNMFRGCTSLIKTPTLPATRLISGCYYSMFAYCTSLTTAPELPATTLIAYCYTSMFEGCTSLTTIPKLPSTLLFKGCYKDMFRGCTSLTTIPELLAITLADDCYSYMFFNCTNIKLSITQTDEYRIPYRIPTSGAGIIAPNALAGMFTKTGGTFVGTPEINTTYYLSTSNTIV